MILEIATLNVRAGATRDFETAFVQASPIIAGMPGYISHELQRCLEAGNRYALLVRWETLEAHTVGFRGSPQYQDWKRLLHHFYDPFPVVEHFERVLLDHAPRAGVAEHVHNPSTT
ncbi:MAG TPA: antibiotic biosynthesis monooxygenase [Casimicrobiaceae bacterium]